MIRRVRFKWLRQPRFVGLGALLAGGRVSVLMPFCCLEIRWVRW